MIRKIKKKIVENLVENFGLFIVSGFIIILMLVVFGCIYQTYWGEISKTDYQKIYLLLSSHKEDEKLRKIKECVRSALEDDNKIDQLEFMQIKDLIKKYQKKHLVERLRTLVNHPEKEEGAYGKGDQT